MRILVSVFVAGVFVLPIRVTEAQPFGVRLSYDRDPTTSIVVNWNSSSAGDNQVIYGTSPTALQQNAAAEASVLDAPLGTAFTAELTGLRVGTTYYYRAGSPGRYTPADGEAPFEFHTLSSDRCAPVRFVVLGDNRADSDGTGAAPIWPDILAEALSSDPDFMLNTGDMVKNGDNATEWANFLDASQGGFSHVATLPSMGNHDEDATNGDGANFNELFGLPRNSRIDSEDYYSIDVGPMHIATLNTQFNDPSDTEFRAMLEWLDQDLSATTQPWKIVFFHKAIYSRGHHSTGEENNGAINAGVIPILDAHHVDLVFNGHSHDYERYAPSVGVDGAFGGSGRSLPAGSGADIAAEALVPDGATGTTYIVTGGAGAATVNIIPGLGNFCIDAACTFCLGINLNCDGSVLDKDKEATVVYDGSHNYVAVEVIRDYLTVDAISTIAGNSGSGGTTLDHFEMASSEAFGANCTNPSSPGDAESPGSDAGISGGDAASLGAAPGSGRRPQGPCTCSLPGARSRRGSHQNVVLLGAGAWLGARLLRRRRA